MTTSLPGLSLFRPRKKPAATRDLSFGRKGKDSGNEVAGMTSYYQEHLKTITYAKFEEGGGGCGK